MIFKALAKEPKKRFRRIGEFAQALADVWSVSSEKAKQLPKTVLPAAKVASSQDIIVVIPDSSQEQRRRRDLIATLDKIAQGLLQQNRMEKALEACEQMLMLDPTSILALNRKGSLLFQLGKHQEGLDLLEEVLKLAPTSGYALEYKAKLFFQLGRYGEGIAIFDEFIKLRCQTILKRWGSYHSTWIEKGVAVLIQQLYLCTFAEGNGRKGHHVVSRRRTTLETTEVSDATSHSISG